MLEGKEILPHHFLLASSFFIHCSDGLAFWGRPVGDAFGSSHISRRITSSLVDLLCL